MADVYDQSVSLPLWRRAPTSCICFTGSRGTRLRANATGVGTRNWQVDGQYSGAAPGVDTQQPTRRRSVPYRHGCIARVQPESIVLAQRGFSPGTWNETREREGAEFIPRPGWRACPIAPPGVNFTASACSASRQRHNRTRCYARSSRGARPAINSLHPALAQDPTSGCDFRAEGTTARPRRSHVGSRSRTVLSSALVTTPRSKA